MIEERNGKRNFLFNFLNDDDVATMTWSHVTSGDKICSGMKFEFLKRLCMY